jgi:hypothetical protein
LQAGRSRSRSCHNPQMNGLVGAVPSLENIRMADDLDFGHVA